MKEIHTELYQKLVRLHDSMLESHSIWDITNMSPQEIKLKEVNQINQNARLGDDLKKYFNYNKVWFNDHVCNLVEKIIQLLKSSHDTIVLDKKHEIDLRVKQERTKRVIEIVGQEVPPLIRELQGLIRNILHN